MDPGQPQRNEEAAGAEDLPPGRAPAPLVPLHQDHGKFQSPVWYHFATASENQVQCIYCRKSLSNRSSTSSLKHHIEQACREAQERNISVENCA